MIIIIKQITVTIASLSDANCVKCSRDVKICADAKFADATKDQKYDAVILPGGLDGSKTFASVNLLEEIILL